MRQLIEVDPYPTDFREGHGWTLSSARPRVMDYREIVLGRIDALQRQLDVAGDARAEHAGDGGRQHGFSSMSRSTPPPPSEVASTTWVPSAAGTRRGGERRHAERYARGQSPRLRRPPASGRGRLRPARHAPGTARDDVLPARLEQTLCHCAVARPRATPPARRARRCPPRPGLQQLLESGMSRVLARGLSARACGAGHRRGQSPSPASQAPAPR